MNFCEQEGAYLLRAQGVQGPGQAASESPESESDSGQPEAGQGYVEGWGDGHSPGGTRVLQDGISHATSPLPGAGLPGEQAGCPATGPALCKQPELWPHGPRRELPTLSASPGTASPVSPTWYGVVQVEMSHFLHLFCKFKAL